ncbi:MAG: DoxX family protein [Verrucomicrobiota bacterium]
MSSVSSGQSKKEVVCMSTETHVRDIGLLVLRIGIGSMFIWHGHSKLFGGPEMWAGVGQAMGNLGIGFGAPFWGFMAAFAEFFGGIFLILGIFTRVACALMAFTMLVGATMHLKQGDGLSVAAHALELMIVFISVFIMGAGRFSVGRMLPDSAKFLK